MDSRRITTDIALIAVFAALCAAFTLVPGFNVPGFPVPITLQTIAIALCGLLLGPVRGFLAVLLWQLVGFAGVPVFTNYKATTEVLKGPTAGYLMGFLVGAFVLGLLARAVVRRLAHRGWQLWLALFAAVLVMLVIAHIMGVGGLMLNAKLPLAKAMRADVIFWPGDLLKAVLAVGVAVSVYKAFPWLLLGRPDAAELLDEPIARR